jgi:hypothetical protein
MYSPTRFDACVIFRDNLKNIYLEQHHTTQHSAHKHKYCRITLGSVIIE